ncbi:MAG: prenyltransferase [Actinomycetota bacterium]
MTAMVVPEVDGIVTAAQLVETGRTLADLQLPDGMIPWYPGGHCDPWNHVESAMALATVGRVREAELGYQWLVDRQRTDGSWHNYYLADGIEDSKLDVNCVAYIATGVWHHYLATADRGFVEALFPCVDAAMEFVLDLQTKRGEVIWARRADGTPWSYALLTGSSSISHSLGCAVRIAELLGVERPWWAEGRDRLVDAIANRPDAFEPKDRWAMDWYYPVLVGAVTGDDAAKRLESRWDEFIMDGKGVRCVSDRPWVTAAETCECAIAYEAVGDTETARHLLSWAQGLRDTDGRYFTGMVYPEYVHYPGDERTSYTAAAVILAADAIQGTNPTSSLFTDDIV